LLLVLGYILFPVDIIPEAIPLLGVSDDTALLLLELIRRLNKYKEKKALQKSLQVDSQSEVQPKVLEGETLPQS